LDLHRYTLPAAAPEHPGPISAGQVRDADAAKVRVGTCIDVPSFPASA